MAEIGENLALVIGAWMDATRIGSMDPVIALMDADVVWYGFLPGTVCNGKAEVGAFLSRHQRRPPRVTRIEAVERGETIIACLEGPDFLHPGTGQPRSEAFMRVTLERGRIKEMRGVATREEALAGI